MKRYKQHLCVIDKESFGDEAWVEQNFEQARSGKSGLSRIALCERRPVGYLIASGYSSRYAHVHRVVVLRSFRRRGVGIKLMKSFEDICVAKGMVEITLESLESGHEANSFYEQMGFLRLFGERLLEYLKLKGKINVKQRYLGLNPNGEVIVYGRVLVPRPRT